MLRTCLGKLVAAVVVGIIDGLTLAFVLMTYYQGYLHFDLVDKTLFAGILLFMFCILPILVGGFVWTHVFHKPSLENHGYDRL